MNKQELVREVAARRSSSQAAAGRVVDEFLAAVARSLSDGRRVHLRRFGTFDLRRRRGRSIRNPRNGKVYRIPGKLAPVFRCSRTLVELVDRTLRGR
ncbi:MAG: HU family DNA-binding protein [Candidatus Eisenbacteria bacterium]|uniref:HU family DNA-binding protein n=1 Tax=Eiseniibacteriota bacterium TaxID=2212470 RepID=A0A938BPN5_UNCEI|nr:HU family DNA-binding protein [Candidatus Eisenbacteria bacterium]